jgi:hypothetical protein
MAAHFSQKTNLSMALICMVNHSAVEQLRINPIKTQAILANGDCPQINDTNYIVNKLSKIFIHFYSL